MNESNEVPTYQPPEGVNGPTLGIALPDGCKRLRATWDPHTASADRWLASGAAVDEYLYWWRFPPLTASQEARSILAPTPPWPGAVLSGLCDEDGVPTWLAQAGDVRGEQVRIWHGEPWVTTHGSWADSRWVEVRAPRAVPAAPVTERVPVWEAVDRWMPGGRVICGWQWSTQTRDGSVTHDDGTFTPVHDAPTVEVLKDGGQ